jgi:hypothetical protein
VRPAVPVEPRAARWVGHRAAPSVQAPPAPPLPQQCPVLCKSSTPTTIQGVRIHSSRPYEFQRQTAMVALHQQRSAVHRTDQPPTPTAAAPHRNKKTLRSGQTAMMQWGSIYNYLLHSDVPRGDRLFNSLLRHRSHRTCPCHRQGHRLPRPWASPPWQEQRRQQGQHHQQGQQRRLR